MRRRKTNAFEVVAGDDPQLLLPESLRTFDAVFLNGLHDPAPFLPLDWKEYGDLMGAFYAGHYVGDFVERLEAAKGRKNDYPISWVRSHGKGRVFYCSLGVLKAPYSNPLFLLLRRRRRSRRTARNAIDHVITTAARASFRTGSQ